MQNIELKIDHEIAAQIQQAEIHLAELKSRLSSAQNYTEHCRISYEICKQKGVIFAYKHVLREMAGV